MRRSAGAAQSLGQPTIFFVSSALFSFLRHQCTEQNCLFFFTAAAASVSHCRKQARVRLQWPSSYDVTRATLPTRLFRHDYVCHVLVRVTRKRHSYLYNNL